MLDKYGLDRIFGSVLKSENLKALRSCTSRGFFVFGLTLNIDYSGAPYSPECLIALLDEHGENHPTFTKAFAIFEAWEEGQRQPSSAAAVMSRQAMMEIVANDEAELASMLPDAMPPRHFEPFPDVPTAPEASTAPKRPKPCPAVADITMIQTTLWDNWGSEKKPKSGGYKDRVPLNRFGCDIEVWVDAGATIVNIADLRRKLPRRTLCWQSLRLRRLGQAYSFLALLETKRLTEFNDGAERMGRRRQGLDRLPRLIQTPIRTTTLKM